MTYGAYKYAIQLFIVWRTILFNLQYYCSLFLIAACAAANLATGTLNGEHDT